jgi:hypothetical protein
VDRTRAEPSCRRDSGSRGLQDFRCRPEADRSQVDETGQSDLPRVVSRLGAGHSSQAASRAQLEPTRRGEESEYYRGNECCSGPEVLRRSMQHRRRRRPDGHDDARCCALLPADDIPASFTPYVAGDSFALADIVFIYSAGLGAVVASRLLGLDLLADLQATRELLLKLGENPHAKAIAAGRDAGMQEFIAAVRTRHKGAGHGRPGATPGRRRLRPPPA